MSDLTTSLQNALNWAQAQPDEAGDMNRRDEVGETEKVYRIALDLQ